MSLVLLLLVDAGCCVGITVSCGKAVADVGVAELEEPVDGSGTTNGTQFDTTFIDQIFSPAASPPSRATDRFVSFPFIVIFDVCWFMHRFPVAPHLYFHFSRELDFRCIC